MFLSSTLFKKEKLLSGHIPTIHPHLLAPPPSLLQGEFQREKAQPNIQPFPPQVVPDKELLLFLKS